MLTYLLAPFRNLLRGDRTAVQAAVLGAVIGLLFAAAAFGQSGTPVVPNHRVQWKVDPQWPGWANLWIDDAYAGSLYPTDGRWWYQGAKHSNNLLEFVQQHNPAKPSKPSGEKTGDLRSRAGVHEDVGERPRDEKPRIPPDGVISNMIAPDGKSHYSIGGLSAERADALRALETASGIPDDRTKPRLIVIGTEVGRRQVIEDLARDPLFAFWRDKLVVQQYPPNHDAIAADRGFVQPVGDNPVIQAQGPDGTVYWRQETYTGAPELAKALRDKVPGYDPAKDPHPPDAGPKPLAPMGESPWGLILAWLGSIGCPLFGAAGVGGGAIWAYRRRKAGA